MTFIGGLGGYNSKVRDISKRGGEEAPRGRIPEQ